MVDGCPQYRLRLFLSADLAGSTAYKSGEGASVEKMPTADGRSSDVEATLRPIWVHRTREFYREFPNTLIRCYERAIRDCSTNSTMQPHAPKVWKLIGDEIVFCCRIVSHEHLCKCSVAFTEALLEYGRMLESNCKGLDIKGAAWTAAFPARNVTISLRPNSAGPDQETEQEEVHADTQPRDFDFIGPGIDSGFRIAKFATTSRLAVGIELAYLLAAGHGRHHAAVFSYHDRAILKGVIRDRPYPVVSIDTERSHSKKLLAELESRLQNVTPTIPSELARYLLAFMVDLAIEIPFLPESEVSELKQLPGSYGSFKQAWETTAQSLAARLITELQSAEEAGESDNAHGQDTILDGFLEDIPDPPESEMWRFYERPDISD